MTTEEWKEKISSDLHIDMNSLEVEWSKQAVLYFEYASDLAGARKEMDEARARLDLIDADTSKNVRMSPEKYGLVKVTEAAISAAVLASQEHKNAFDQLVDIKYKVALLDAAVSAMDHRKKALEKEVDLFLSGYFAEPRRPRSEHVFELESQQMLATVRPMKRKE